jgi:hypothetical protein
MPVVSNIKLGLPNTPSSGGLLSNIRRGLFGVGAARIPQATYLPKQGPAITADPVHAIFTGVQHIFGPAHLEPRAVLPSAVHTRIVHSINLNG